MKYQLLLLLTLTAFVSCQDTNAEIAFVKTAKGIKLFCHGNQVQRIGDSNKNETLELDYLDDNTGEYGCVDPEEDRTYSTIYVKFRTCDNCIDIEPAALTALVLGNVAVTVIVGVTVYFFTFQKLTAQDTSNKKSADNRRVAPNERRSRAPNDHYQSLRPRNVQKRDEYEEVQRKKKQKSQTPSAPPLPET